MLRDRVVAAIGDRYDVETEIGRGGSAVVYRATDVRLRRKVALKVLPPELAYRDEVRQRFLREAQTSAQLSHPNIVPIYSVDEHDGLVYFVMQLVEGESLAGRLIRDPRPPIPVVRRILSEVAEALAYAHSQGIVHRDIKPGNILLDASTGRALVTDFGIARALEEESRLTLTGIAVGTPAYMSPEQAVGERAVDALSDVYSLGVVSYQMIAGEPPFQATNTPAMLMKHISETPVPLGRSRPDAPASLVVAVERALAKRPEDRWPDVRAFRDAALRDDAPLPARPVLPSQPSLPPPVGMPAISLSGNPPVPLFPAGDDQDMREQWRWQQRAWREQVRAQQRAREKSAQLRTGAPENVMVPPGAAPTPTLAEAFERFRRRSMRAAVTLTVLTFINLVTFPIFPWVIFPAMGIIGKLKHGWRPLREAGVTVSDVINGTLPAHLNSGRATASPPTADQRRQLRAEALAEKRRQRRLVHWRDLARLERRARIFRSATRVAGGSAVVALVSLTIGGATGIDAFIAPFVMGLTTTGAGLLTAAWASRKLRKAGVRLRGLLRGDWQAKLMADDPRGIEERAAEELRLLAPPDVLAGPHGEAVRRAVRDRLEVRATFSRMSPADRAMLPDVAATVDGLVERVGMLAQALHRLDADRPEAMLAALEGRLVLAEGEAASSPDGERRLALLQRQRSTLQDLVSRREMLASQLENAALVLESVRLDLLKLRSAGVQASLGNVTSATQEARALSRDIGHMLEAVDEVNRM